MIGLAVRPGTDVEPMCSMRNAASPSAAAIRLAELLVAIGPGGSYSDEHDLHRRLDALDHAGIRVWSRAHVASCPAAVSFA